MFVILEYSISSLYLLELYLRTHIYDLFNCSWTKFIAIIVNVLVFFMQIFRLTILRFSRTFFDFSRLFHAFVLHFWVISIALTPK